jgi:hypothetical protein
MGGAQVKKNEKAIRNATANMHISNLDNTLNDQTNNSVNEGIIRVKQTLKFLHKNNFVSLTFVILN